MPERVTVVVFAALAAAFICHGVNPSRCPIKVARERVDEQFRSIEKLQTVAFEQGKVSKAANWSAFTGCLPQQPRKPAFRYIDRLVVELEKDICYNTQLGTLVLS